MNRARWPGWLKVLGWLGALVWAVLLVVQSGSPSVGGFLSRLLAGLPVGADKVGHAAAYAVLGGFLTLATGRVWLAVLLATLFGVSVGALLGALGVAFLSRLGQRRT